MSNSTDPSPVVMIAAITEALKSVLGELRSIAADHLNFQLKFMELLPPEDRLSAFELVVEANTAFILSDERVQMAMLTTVEKMGAAAAAVIPTIISDRRAEITDRAARRANEVRDAADRAAVEGIKTKTVK